MQRKFLAVCSTTTTKNETDRNFHNRTLPLDGTSTAKGGGTTSLGKRAQSITTSTISNNRVCGISVNGDTAHYNTLAPFWDRVLAIVGNTISRNGRSTLSGSGGIVFTAAPVYVEFDAPSLLYAKYNWEYGAGFCVSAAHTDRT